MKGADHRDMTLEELWSPAPFSLAPSLFLYFLAAIRKGAYVPHDILASPSSKTHGASWLWVETSETVS